MYEIFEQLLQKNNVTAYKVSKEAGVSQSMLSEWKKGTYTPKQDKLQKIADYFGVTVDYLMTGKEKENLPHFLDNEARKIAQELANRPDLKILFDTGKKVSEDDLKAVIEIVKKLEDKQNI